MTQTHILVVDPSDPQRESLTSRLKAMGFAVSSTSSGSEAGRLLETIRPNLALLDVGVKDLTPDRFLSILHQKELDTFTILLTDSPDMDEAMDWITDGAFACLTKPVSPERLKKIIDKGLENQESFHQVVQLAEDLGEANSNLEQDKLRLAEKTEQLRFLYELALLLSATLDAYEVVRIVSQAMVELIGAKETAFYIKGRDGKKSRIYTREALSEAVLEKILGIIREEIHHGSKPEVENRYVNRDGRPAISLPEYRMVLPLPFGEKVYGHMLLFFDRPPKPDEDLKLLLDSVALHASQALRNAHRHALALHQASRDPLTGLLNRRAFREHLLREFGRHRRHASDFSVILIDLDRFKNVNDNLGHDAGDQVLKTVARIIDGSVRSVDVTARIGGEEFAVLAPDTTEAEAMTLARRIKKFLSRAEPILPGRLNRQTVSQGVAGTDRNMIKNPDDPLRLADKAMYRAKSEGRDTIRLASGPADNPERKGSVYAVGS